MTPDDTLVPLARRLAATVRQVMSEIRPPPLPELLAQYLPTFVYASDEADPQIIGDAQTRTCVCSSIPSTPANSPSAVSTVTPTP